MEVQEYFGIGTVSIPAAAQLIAVDMFFSGEIEIDLSDFEKESYGYDDPVLIEKLKPHIERLKLKFIDAVNAGTLETSLLRRDLEEALIVDETYIDLDVLGGWLLDRGYEPGDAFSDYLAEEGSLISDIDEEVRYRRLISANKKVCKFEAFDFLEDSVRLKSLDLVTKENIHEACKYLVLENDNLKTQIAELSAIGNIDQCENEKNLSTKERDCLLRALGFVSLILAKNPAYKFGEKPSASSIANKICEEAEKLGVSVNGMKRVDLKITEGIQYLKQFIEK